MNCTIGWNRADGGPVPAIDLVLFVSLGDLPPLGVLKILVAYASFPVDGFTELVVTHLVVPLFLRLYKIRCRKVSDDSLSAASDAPEYRDGKRAPTLLFVRPIQPVAHSILFAVFVRGNSFACINHRRVCATA